LNAQPAPVARFCGVLNEQTYFGISSRGRDLPQSEISVPIHANARTHPTRQIDQYAIDRAFGFTNPILDAPPDGKPLVVTTTYHQPVEGLLLNLPSAHNGVYQHCAEKHLTAI